jgi:hypothetical protein
MKGADDEAHEMNERTRYARAWQDLRRRKVVVFLLFMPTFLWIVWQLQYGSSAQTRVLAPLSLTLVILAATAILWYSLFRCPRCHHFFFLTAGWRSFTGRRCIHCGLRRGASYEEARVNNTQLK